jgi:hypothetical protein
MKKALNIALVIAAAVPMTVSIASKAQLAAEDHPVHKCLRGAIQAEYDIIMDQVSLEESAKNYGDLKHERIDEVFWSLNAAYPMNNAPDAVERDLSQRSDLFALPVRAMLRRESTGDIVPVKGCAIVAVGSESYDRLLGKNSGLICGVRSIPDFSTQIDLDIPKLGLNLVSEKTGKPLVGDLSNCGEGAQAYLSPRKLVQKALKKVAKGSGGAVNSQFLRYLESTDDLQDFSEYMENLDLIIQEKPVIQKKPVIQEKPAMVPAKKKVQLVKPGQEQASGLSLPVFGKKPPVARPKSLVIKRK